MSRMSVLVLGCFLFLTGCAKTTVVLLPDEGGSVGQVVVQSVGKQSAGEQRVLSKMDERVKATAGGLSATSTLSPEAITRTFGPTLKALPEKPESVLIYFASESTQPTPESVHQLPQLVEKLKTRTAPSVEVFGHTDHLGDRAFNQNLSDARAREVQRLLISQDVPAESINMRGFGDRDPLVPPQPGKAEPRNRRVEIFIR